MFAMVSVKVIVTSAFVIGIQGNAGATVQARILSTSVNDGLTQFTLISWPAKAIESVLFGILTRSTVQARIRQTSVGLFYFTSVSATQRRTQTSERITLLETLTSFLTRVRYTWILLDVTTISIVFSLAFA